MLSPTAWVRIPAAKYPSKVDAHADRTYPYRGEVLLQVGGEEERFRVSNKNSGWGAYDKLLLPTDTHIQNSDGERQHPPSGRRITEGLTGSFLHEGLHRLLFAPLWAGQHPLHLL